MHENTTIAAVPADFDAPVWDWYQATVRTDPEHLAAVVMAGLGCDELRDTKGRHGYQAGFELVKAGDVLARVLYGGANGAPNISASGPDAQALASIVRDRWPEHRVTRFDSAYDRAGAGAWDELYAIVLRIAEKHRIKIGTVGDWIRPDAPEGRTLYLGSTSSPVRVRLYEKGKQVRALGLAPDDRAPLDWVRLEVQVRPQKSAKSVAAGLDAIGAWSMSKWTRELHDELLATELEPNPMHEWRAPDDARARKYLLRQYGPLLRREVERHGSWAELGEWLGRALAGEIESPDAWGREFDTRAAATRLRDSHQ